MMFNYGAKIGIKNEIAKYWMRKKQFFTEMEA